MFVSTVEMLLVTDNLRTVLATVLARLRFSPAAAAGAGVDRGTMEGMLVMLILFFENMFGLIVVLLTIELGTRSDVNAGWW